MTTENTVWIFDLDLERYMRIPRSEHPQQASNVAYTGEWDEYSDLEPIVDAGDNKLIVYRPVPFGQGAIRITGPIIEDTEESDDRPLPPHEDLPPEAR